MKKIQDVLRLKSEGRSNEQIALILNIGETSVRRYLQMAEQAGISWPLSENMDGDLLEKTLYPFEKNSKFPLPDFEHIHKELSRKGVTLHLLWEEYRKLHPDGYSRSRYCELYQRWAKADDASMLQTHKAAEATFIDYSGQTIPIFEEDGRIAYEAQIFVAVLGASSYIFCEATQSQKLEDWTASHVRMSEYFGGVTEYWIPDNLKSGVRKADRYEPLINESYDVLAVHYKAAVVPARAGSPKDKAKAENAVRLVQMHVLAPLRDLRFFSLAELNKAVSELLDSLNRRPFQKMPGSSRHSLYLEIEKEALRSLPECPFVFYRYGTGKVPSDYHVSIERVPYSVPYQWIGRPVVYRYNERTIEIFSKNMSRIAMHPRSFTEKVPVTCDEHRPAKHRHQARCNQEEICKEAKMTGVSAFEWVEKIFQDPSLQQRKKINITMGVVRLTKMYPHKRIDAACTRALFYHNFTFGGIKDILKGGLDTHPLPEKEPKHLSARRNIRGGAYYIKILQAPWNEDFFRELENFPEGGHDDIVDALSGAFLLLNESAYDLNALMTI